MRALGRSFPVLVSAWAHAGIVLSLLAFAAGSPISAERGGAGAVDAGGEDFGSAMEDDLDFGPVTTKLVGIGIVVDSPQARVELPETQPEAVAPAAEVAAVSPASVVHAPIVSAKPVQKPVEKAKVDPDTQPEATERLASNAEQSGDDGGSSDSETTVETAVEREPTDAVASLVPGSKGRKPSGKGEKKPCPIVEDDGVEKLGEHAWTVERDVAEYYARHLKELQKIASVRLVKNDAGKPDGFRVGVPRCSILREGGLRSGDVVKSVNGVHVHDVFTAIGAYFKLRREETIVLNVVRKGEKLTLRYTMV